MLQSMGLQRVGHDWATELNWLILFQILSPYRHRLWVVLRCLDITPVAVKSSPAVPMNDWLPEALLPSVPTHLALWHKHTGRDWIETMNVACVFGAGSMRKCRRNRNLKERLLVIKAAFYLSIPFIMILQNCCHIKRQPKSAQPKTTDNNETGVSGSELIQTINFFYFSGFCYGLWYLSVSKNVKVVGISFLILNSYLCN